MDGDECVHVAEVAQLRELGLSSTAIKEALVLKRHKESASMLRFMVHHRVWESDKTVDMAETYLRLSAVLDKLSQRPAAIVALQDGLSVLDTLDHVRGLTSSEEPSGGGETIPTRIDVPASRASLSLALAKLLFRADSKREAFQLCEVLMVHYRQQKLQQQQALDPDGEPKTVRYSVTTQQAEDAWYLAGWVRIHGDDHTSAYALWSEGHTVIPSSLVLARQFQKRKCWDAAMAEETCLNQDFVGNGAYEDGVIDVLRDLDAFEVVPTSPKVSTEGEGHERRYACPALALFDGQHQGRRLVFRTRKPVLTRKECKAILDEVDRCVWRVCCVSGVSKQ